MPERATINEVTQIGVETTEGTAVPANKFLPSISLKPSINATTNEQTTQGVKLPTIHSLGKEYSDWAMESNGPTYDEIAYPLQGILKKVTPVQNGATTAYTETMEPSGTAPDVVETFTAESGSSVRAMKAAGLRVVEFGLDWDREKLTLSGALVGKAVTDGITLTGSPTSLPQIVMLPNDISIYSDTTSGGLGGSKLLRSLKGSLKLGNRFGQVWPNDKAQTSFAASVELPVQGTLDLTLAADAAGMAYLTKIRAATRAFVRIDITSDVLAGTGFPYKLLIDLAVDVAKLNPMSDENGVYAIPVSFGIAYDATWGKWISVALTNKVTAL